MFIHWRNRRRWGCLWTRTGSGRGHKEIGEHACEQCEKNKKDFDTMELAIRSRLTKIVIQKSMESDNIKSIFFINEACGVTVIN